MERNLAGNHPVEVYSGHGRKDLEERSGEMRSLDPLSLKILLLLCQCECAGACAQCKHVAAKGHW